MLTDPPTLLIAAIVVVLAMVQSVFGVGLLLFGTPVLLLLGMPFTQVLAYLLPCSIAVSLLQVFTTGGVTLEPFRRQFLAYAVPAVLIGTTVALLAGAPQIKLLVGVMLLLTACIRFGPLRNALGRRVRGHLRPMMVGLGLMHGLSNLGGGVLTVIVGSCAIEKAEIRRHIAFAYGAMAIVQLAVVLSTQRAHLNIALWLSLPALAAGVYLLVGQRVFRAVSQRAYQFGLTGMIACFGALLVATA
ncbi:MAG: sulfite exporter TauE/SafE family protein [Actinomycetota bacterium]|nr:sulfite exporter TauE/SafE family protein [Actinomycetota bacterium]